MESLIPFIIMLLVGSLFSSKKKNASEEPKKAKPFTTANDRHDGPVKKLKEMSKDIYKEIQKELEESNDQPHTMPERTIPKPEVKVRPERIEVSIPRVETTKPSRVSRSSRHEQKEVVKKQRKIVPQTNIMPKTPDDIMKGVIFSEILGPPKSKR